MYDEDEDYQDTPEQIAEWKREREAARAKAAAGPQRFVLHQHKLAADGLDCGRWRERLDANVGYENWRQEKTTPNGRIYVMLRGPEFIMMTKLALDRCMVPQQDGRMFSPTGGEQGFIPRKSPSKVDTTIRTIQFTIKVRKAYGRNGDKEMPTIPFERVERLIQGTVEGKCTLTEYDGVYTLKTEDRYAEQRVFIVYGHYGPRYDGYEFSPTRIGEE